VASEMRHMRPRLKAKLLSPGDRPAASEYLGRDSVRNLHLLELAESVGAPPKPGELAPQVVGAWRGRDLVGVASLRPGVTLDANMDEEVLNVLMPYLRAVKGGLIKSGREIATELWERLSSRGCVAMVDRAEIACLVKPGDVVPASLPPGAVLRQAVDSDLEALVAAARASLREEDRPDPCDGDPVGFRLWVRGRLYRARVVECDGQVVFVGYADVRRPEGWLIQGVYTWPYARRRGMAAAAMYGVVCEAFEAGTDHVQLAVIRGNTAAIGLYQKLGFSTFAELRTILFA
jgi:ribosomal protein S18 acetylase RimI-like enzyme